MKKSLCTICLSWLVALWAPAQAPSEGKSYYLPKTEIQFKFLVEKSTYEPGQLCMYADRYMKKSDVAQKSSVTYRILDTKMASIGVPDTAKHFTLSMDKKYSIGEVHLSDNGVLLAINDQPKAIPQEKPFLSAPKQPRLNPQDYMNEDILTAGSTAKMAELTAQEIYDIRESRNMLQRGQADFMPKDGEQMRIMMQGLDTQERALRQAFEGVTDKDTTEVVISYIPTKAVEREMLFRFSSKLGFVDIDDLGGAPYYISIEEEQKPAADPEGNKKDRDDIGLHVNMPAKIKVTLYQQEKAINSYTLYMGQFGQTESLSGALFGRKQTTKLILNPITGALESIKEVNLQ
ncbi:MAG: DUF4831 family protein [Prevotella sp.]|nr:DUF4831 family protein [Prevotella sp.]